MWLIVGVVLAAVEIPYDGIDQDGDGADLVDRDGDGFAGRLALGPDCNDDDPEVHPMAVDWMGDGRDQNCDGGDGWCVRYAFVGPDDLRVRVARLGDIRSCEGDYCEKERPDGIDYKCYATLPHQWLLRGIAGPDTKRSRRQPGVRLDDVRDVDGQFNKTAESSHQVQSPSQ